MNYLGLIIAGLVGTAAMTMVMAVAPRMGMPKMDVVGQISAMSGQNRTVALVIHFMMGAVFAVIYGFLGFTGTITSALIFGGADWLIAGAIMGIAPSMMKQEGPGFYMMNNGGMMAFIGGLIGHWVFAIVAGLTLGLF